MTAMLVLIGLWAVLRLPLWAATIAAVTAPPTLWEDHRGDR